MKVQTTSWINMDTYSSDPVQTDFRKPFWVWPWWTYQVKLGCVYGFLRPLRTCVDNLSAIVQWSFQIFRHEALPIRRPSDMNSIDFHLQTRYPPNMKTFKPSNMKPSTWQPSERCLQTWSHQTWSPSNMKPFKYDETFSSLQTWSHQHDNPQKDAFKHEAIKHEALQTWSPPKMKTFKHEALQTWWNVFKTSNMKPSTRRPSEGCLQTWSHQTWSHQTWSPSKTKSFKHDALQTWCPPNNSLNLFWSARPIDLVHPVKWTKIAMSN